MAKSDDAVFSVVTTTDGLPPIIAIGITPKAWADLQNEQTRTFDLQQIGVPIRIMLFGCASKERGIEILQQAAAANGVELEDRRSQDVSTPEPKGH